MCRRDNDGVGVPDKLTRHSVKLVRHFPVYGAESSSGLHQTKANDAKTNWDELMEGGELRALIEETALAVKKHDPARVRWDVSAEEDKVFVDASSECC
ncbi:hypothetical protein T01_10264 [Trichinella spiralis]|uniref:DUF7047 domain-containing protein n=1 Tax=Trichinella spiralis TaxID=6334 RepID=A0A0V1B9E5_TRISP|nr:hypothetical protein T01_10264 [Trichinella spiralis]